MPSIDFVFATKHRSIPSIRVCLRLPRLLSFAYFFDTQAEHSLCTSENARDTNSNALLEKKGALESRKKR